MSTKDAEDSARRPLIPMNEMGGDAACWAHLVEEDRDAAGQGVTVHPVDLVEIAARFAGRGPAWTMRSDDLDTNLLVFVAGDGVAEHVNSERDVLLVGISGEGLVRVDGAAHPLTAGQAIVIRNGARRGTEAVSERFAYLSCHLHRSGLVPTTKR